MRCDAVQQAISEGMDTGASLAPAAASHSGTCPRCRAYQAGAWRVRDLTRFEIAPPVPDLVPSIMAAVETEAGLRRGGRRLRAVRRPSASAPSRFRVGVAALVAGFVIGSVVTVGGVLPREETDRAALAAAIPHHLLRAAEGLTGYRATFDITERNWTAAVPLRTFVAEIAFVAPEGFRVEVRDTTSYPSSVWPRNDLLLETDGWAWRVAGPNPCPAAALPACPQPQPVERTVMGRPPFDSRTAMPTDVIVPMTVLAASDRVDVIGGEDVDGRGAVAVALRYQDGASLLQYLRFLGSWRPFFPQDRMVVWLDAETWFPLRYEVFPAPGPERVLWAVQVGLPGPEDPSVPVFAATATALSTALGPAPAVRADPSQGHSDEGFQDDSLPGVSPVVTPILTPGETLGLRPWRSGRYARSATRPYDQTLSAFTDGLNWLTVTRVEGWNQDRLFGVGDFAEAVEFSGGGVGYYEPAGGDQSRRVAVHAAQGEFLVASNLPRASLLRVAGSLPVTGMARPIDWQVRRLAGGEIVLGVAPNEAVAAAGFDVLEPDSLPPGYREAAAHSVRTPTGEGLVLVYRRPAAELDGVGLRLYQATGQTLAPPHRPDLQAVAVGGLEGRWSPQDHLLEWMDGGVYRSLTGPGLDLSTILLVAVSLHPPGSDP